MFTNNITAILWNSCFIYYGDILFFLKKYYYWLFVSCVSFKNSTSATSIIFKMSYWTVILGTTRYFLYPDSFISSSFFFFTECFVHIFDLHILLKNASVVAFSNRWSQQLIMKPLLSEILVILSKNDCRLMVELPQLSTEL